VLFILPHSVAVTRSLLTCFTETAFQARTKSIKKRFIYFCFGLMGNWYEAYSFFINLVDEAGNGSYENDTRIYLESITYFLCRGALVSQHLMLAVSGRDCTRCSYYFSEKGRVMVLR